MSEIKAKRQAILVLGMHRSGTSAATRVVNLLGAQLGDRMLSPAADNESGFWEHEDVVRINDALLAALGRGWHDLRPLPEGWMHSDPAKAARAELVEMLGEQFHGDMLWAVKDPRMCLLAPLWVDVLRELEVETSALLVVRHPAEVAQSLHMRDGLPLPQSLWLWLHYTVAAEHATRGLLRAAVNYHSLLADWRDTMARAAAAMGVDWPNSANVVGQWVDAFLDVGRRHHEHGEADDAGLPLAIRGMYEALLAAERDGSSWAVAKRIADDYIGAEGLFELGFEAASAVCGRAGSANVAMDRELLSSLASNVLDEAPVEPATPPKLRDIAKLYWQCGDDAFEEDRVESIEHMGMATPTRFVFRLPSGVRPDSVRFDPSMLSGQFEVFGLRVDGIPIDDVASRVLQVHQHRLPSNGPEHVRVLGLDGDPWVRFDLSDCPANDGGSMAIEVMCRYESARDWIRNIIDVAVVSGMSSTVQTTGRAVTANLDAIRNTHDRQMQAVADHQEHMDAHVAGIERNILDLSDRCARHEAAILDAIRNAHDRQMQAAANHQERVDAHVEKIERDILDLSDRFAQHEAAIVRALTDALAENIGTVKQHHEVLSRMVGEQQARLDAKMATMDHDLARNMQQLAQLETAMQTQLDRLLEGVAAILNNQNTSFWSKLRQK